jgi:predicted metal-binding membrane protein
MWIRVNDRRVFVIVMAALIALCWLSLSIWSLSPYAPFLSHDMLEEVRLAISPEYVLLLFVFVIGWTLMTTAMMLPTSLPLVVLFYGLVRTRRNRLQLVALLIAGYLAIWTAFGLLAHLGDMLVHKMAHQIAWLEANTWVIGAATLAVAGLYQFASLKHACLDKCRSPLSFVMEHWRGRQEQMHAFSLGVHHGLFCLGCCWSLMLLMFAVGSGNIAWMLMLGVIMGVEKNMPWGRQISKPLGIVLLGFSVIVASTGAGILSA